MSNLEAIKVLNEMYSEIVMQGLLPPRLEKQRLALAIAVLALQGERETSARMPPAFEAGES